MNRERWIELGVLGAGSVVLSVALGKIYETMGGVWIIAGALGSCLVLVLYSVSLSYGIRLKNEERIDKLIKIFNSSEFKEKLDFIFSKYEVDEIERNQQEKDIWVVSPNLENDTNNSDVVPIVRENAKKGVRYTYVVPDNELIDAREQELQAVFKGIRCKARIVKVSEKDFFLLTTTHLTVYNPQGENGTPGRVFLELPVQNRGWWVEMCRQDASYYIGRVRKIIDHNSV